MTPEERAEAAYQSWISQVSEDVRRLIEGTPYRALFIQVVASAISDTQQTVSLGSGTAELPHGHHS
jgi:hypothetical protein